MIIRITALSFKVLYLTIIIVKILNKIYFNSRIIFFNFLRVEITSLFALIYYNEIFGN